MFCAVLCSFISFVVCVSFESYVPNDPMICCLPMLRIVSSVPCHNSSSVTNPFSYVTNCFQCFLVPCHYSSSVTNPFFNLTRIAYPICQYRYTISYNAPCQPFAVPHHASLSRIDSAVTKQSCVYNDETMYIVFLSSSASK